MTQKVKPKITCSFVLNTKDKTKSAAELKQLCRNTTLASFTQAYEKSPFIEFLSPKCEISILLCDDDEIKELNHNYRNKDKATNVLSFAALEDDEFLDFDSDEPLFLGDIAISLETVEKEAVEKNISFNNHLCHMMVHGVLHLMGFDHQEDNQAESMESLEASILSSLGIDNPYC